jgi:hypothetical protein
VIRGLTKRLGPRWRVDAMRSPEGCAGKRRAVKATTVSEPPGAVNARRLKRCASKELHR